MSEVRKRTGGTVKLGTGTLYTALKRLREDGLIEEVPDPEPTEDERQRRTYALTSDGRACLDDQSRRLQALVDHAVAKKALPDPERA